MRAFVVSLFISAIGPIPVWLSGLSRDSGKPSSEFCEIYGASCDYFDFFESENQDCLQPEEWGGFTNGCTRKGCVDGEAECGTSTQYANLVEEFVVSTSAIQTSLWYETTPTHCSFQVICITGGYDATKNCEEAHQTVQGENTLYIAGDCEAPNPGPPPTGCTLCSNGGMDTYHPNQTYTTVYDVVWCPW